MAVAPVLERQVNTENEIATEVSSTSVMTADERHNSRISLNYARLINPEMTIGDIIQKEEAPRQLVEEPVREQKPYLVENARADSELFRADSIINRRQTEVAAMEDEEENEDLRPTPTTIQYRTEAVSKVSIDDKISNKQAKAHRLSKRDKIIMAVAFVVIAALFILVIINSAVLSNLHSEVSYLQNDLVAAQESYEEVLESKEAFFENIEQTVSDFAQQNGMSKI